MKGQTSTRTKVLHALMIVVLTILLLLFIAPFILVVINVFKTKADINTAPLALIGKHGFTLENFPRAMDKMNFVTVFGNSAVITISATILTILFSAMCAYVIVRNPSWKFGGMVFALMVASMVIPFQVLMVPLVSVYGGLLDVLNSRITLILMHTGFSVSLAVFMFHGAIKTNIPNELEEAASIDGCSKWRTFWTIVFPLLKPTVATVAIIDAMAFWNDYLLPSLVLGRRRTVHYPDRNPDLLRHLLQRYRPDHGGPTAGHAADPHPVPVPAALHRRRRDLRRSQGLIERYGIRKHN